MQDVTIFLMRIGNKKFPMIKRYYSEYIMSIFSEGNLALGIGLYGSQSVSSKFLGFSLVETQVSGSGSGVPDKRLRVIVLFQLSTTWLNSTVKGSAPRLLTGQL